MASMGIGAWMCARQSRRALSLCAIVLVILTCTLVVAAAAPPSLPQKLPPTGDCAVDNIFYGATPPGSDGRPVLVFVHGLWGIAEDWWLEKPATGPDTLYRSAYDAGYRTAFVSLTTNPLTPEDCTAVQMPGLGMQHGGRVLSQQLDAILAHYSVSKVEIVTHSKGGLDAQSAIVRYGAWSKVNNVFMLGPPNQGSLLADYLHTPESAWLHGIMPPDAATFSIRTAMMETFRAEIDASTLDDEINYYVGAGNMWQSSDPSFGVFQITGQWLQDAEGDNDGIVNVSSTMLAGATQLFLQPWNHGQLTKGTNSFPYIQQVLEGQPVESKVYLPMIVAGEP